MVGRQQAEGDSLLIELLAPGKKKTDKQLLAVRIRKAKRGKGTGVRN